MAGDSARLLIVAATSLEVAPIVQRLRPLGDCGLRTTRYAFKNLDVDLLIAGVGLVATASRCAAALARAPYDLALNLGVCGSFDRALAPVTVVHVISDRIADLGAEDGDAFLSVLELNLLDADEPPFSGGRLVNSAPPANPALSRLPAVDGISVNTSHGNERSIAAVAARLNPQVESMEGAAFMFACLTHGVPFAQVRAVSNFVERRNRAAWRLDDAIGALGGAALDILDAL